MNLIKKRELLILTAVAAFAFIPLFFLRDYTPKNELKYITIASAMADNSQYFTLYDNNTIYTDKPPFFFWLINLVKSISGSYNLGYIGTVLSFFPAFSILIMAFFFSINYLKKLSPLVVPLILITMPLFFISASSIRMDILMCSFITGSLLLFFLIYDNKILSCRKNSYFIYILMGLSIYVKGAAGIVVPLITILSFLILERNLSFLKKIYFLEGLGILIFMLALWFIPAVYFNGTQYLNDIFGKQLVGRTVNAFVHKRPFYYYAASLPALYFQWIPLLTVTLMIYFYTGIKKLEKYEKFMLIWFSSAFLLFSAVSSKLWIYILPVVFPTAVLMGSSLEKLFENKDKTYKKIIVLTSSIIMLIGFAIVILLNKEIKSIFFYDFLFSGITFILCSLYTFFIIKNGGINPLIFSSILPFFALILNLIFIIPKYNSIIGLREAAKVINSTNTKSVISYNFQAGMYAKYYLKKDITIVSTENSVFFNSLTKDSLILMETKDFSKLNNKTNFLILYKNSQYCIFRLFFNNSSNLQNKTSR